MTTIAARQYSHGVLMASDGFTIDDNNRVFNDKRMVKHTERSGYLIGAAGWGLPCEEIVHRAKLPKIPADVDPYTHLVRKVVPALAAALEKIGFPFGKDSDTEILIALKGEVFEISSDGAVLCSPTSMYAIGSGAKYALGAMAYDYNCLPVEAVWVALSLDHHTGIPVISSEQNKENSNA